MGDVSVVGLGLMGSALARALANNKHRVTVWNRTSEKAKALVEVGVRAAANFNEAVQSSPLILVCLDSYDTSRSLFGAPDIARVLPKHAVVQLTTGTPREARTSGLWFRGLGADYLDAAILAGPARIGLPSTTILYAGQRHAFEDHQDTLLALAGDSRFVGEDDGAAAALDLAWLSKLYGTFVGAAHGVVLCEFEGVDLASYASLFGETDSARWLIDVIRNGCFTNPDATLSVWNTALHRIIDSATDKGTSDEVPIFIAGILDRAEAEGLGNQHIAALVKILRRAKPGS